MSTITPLRPSVRRLVTDEDVVAGLRLGDPAAVDALHARHAPALLAFARHLLGGDHHDAEECVQDGLLRAVRAVARDPGREIALRAFLHAIVRNACLDRMRARAVRPSSPLDRAEAVLEDRRADPVAAVLRRERLVAVVDGVRALPERQRAALVLHGLEGHSHAETGRRLGIGEGASKALVHRARTGLHAAAA